MAELEVRAIGDNGLVMKREVAYEGNGLIIEITVRKSTRFYLHHDRLEDSNSVDLTLEGNKEYRLEAWNELTVPVTIICMIQGADVYLDDAYQGVIGHDLMLTLQGVSGSEHDFALFAEQKRHTSIFLAPTSAELSSKVTSHGGETVTEVGFYYSTSEAVEPPYSEKVSLAYSKDAFSYSVNGLSINMKHYLIAYSSNPKGLSYGPESTFTTTDERYGINGE